MKVSYSRLLIFILSVLILLSSIPTHAEVVQSSVTGRITTDSSRDLSGIEIRVYSAIPVPCNENNSGTLYFGELYSFSVFTDEIGGFSFVKPSNYCSLSIVLESLPDNYGVSCQTQFLPPHRTFVDIVIKQVHKVETSLVDGIISPSFFSEEGIPLLASYSI